MQKIATGIPNISMVDVKLCSETNGQVNHWPPMQQLSLKTWQAILLKVSWVYTWKWMEENHLSEFSRRWDLYGEILELGESDGI